MMKKSHPSKSECNGLNELSSNDKIIYSVGISTAGTAEIRMAKQQPLRRISATTIDNQGAQTTKKLMQKLNLDEQIEVKLEDITQKLPYLNHYFDFIYARLILHYLDKKQLQKALKELYRTLKIDGKIFIVVRSDKCLEAQSENAKYDSLTGMTTYTSSNKISYSRFFHTPESIENYLLNAGFKIHNIQNYEEQLFVDFNRTEPAKQIDHLIEVTAKK